MKVMAVLSVLLFKPEEFGKTHSFDMNSGMNGFYKYFLKISQNYYKVQIGNCETSFTIG